MSKISFQYELVRAGVRFGHLLCVGGADIACVADAAIKMTLTGMFQAPNTDVDFLHDKIRPYMIIDGAVYPLGEYNATTDAGKEDGVGHKIKVTAYDNTYLVKISKIEHRISIPAGKNYIAAVTQLLIESGITDYRLEPSSRVLQTAREDWEPGVDRLTIANQLLAEINYRSLFADLHGTLCAVPYTQPGINNINVAYADDGQSIILPELEDERDTFDRANVFRVAVNNPDFDTEIVAVAENNDADSPTSTFRRRRRILQCVTLDNIGCQQELQNYADILCFKSKMAAESIMFTTALNPMHTCFDCIALKKGARNGLYEETAWSIHLAYNGTMTHKARRVIYL